MASGSWPMKRCSKLANPSIVSPEPIPTTPSSVSTRTSVTANDVLGRGSQAAGNGGSSGTASRTVRIAVIFMCWSIAHGGPAKAVVDIGERTPLGFGGGFGRGGLPTESQRPARVDRQPSPRTRWRLPRLGLHATRQGPPDNDSASAGRGRILRPRHDLTPRIHS